MSCSLGESLRPPYYKGMLRMAGILEKLPVPVAAELSRRDLMPWI